MKYFRDLGILCASGQRTVFVKRSLSSFGGKFHPYWNSDVRKRLPPRYYPACQTFYVLLWMGHENIRARERKERKKVSPAIVSDETFFSTNKRVCIKCAAIKVNHVILSGGSKGQFVLDQEIISITFRVNNTGSSAQPPVHVHSRAPPRPASPPSAAAPGLTQRQALIEGHINHATQTSKAKDNWITWLSAVMNTIIGAGWRVCFHCISSCRSSFWFPRRHRMAASLPYRPFPARNNPPSTVWDAALKSPVHFRGARWYVIISTWDAILHNVRLYGCMDYATSLVLN